MPGVFVSNFLPATHGIRALQDVMIRGETLFGYDLLGLGVIAAATLGAARYFMGRGKR